MSSRNSLWCRSVISIGVLSAFCLFDARASECGNALARRLAADGRSLGQDAMTGEILAVGEHRMRFDDGVPLSQRDQCVRAAELSAKRTIIQAMESVSSGRRKVSLGDGKEQFSAYDLFAGQQLIGWSVVEMAEKVEGSNLVVAVAISWSPASEANMRKMMAGQLRAADNWEGDARDFTRSQTTHSGSRVFMDKQGCPHLLGIGVAQLSDESQLQRNRAMRWADSLAQKNLMLAMRGTTCALESLVKCQNEKPVAEGDDVELLSGYGSATDLHDNGEVPEGIGPLTVFPMTHPVAGRKCLVSVWDYKPVVKQDGRGVISGGDAGRTTRCVGVKVFNPATGKYEEVCK